MNGKNKYLLDTNAIISLLGGNSALNEVIKGGAWLGISIISELEFLSYPQLEAQDAELFNRFKDKVEVVDLSGASVELIRSIIRIRKEYKVKLPDAIIVATTMEKDALLLTADQQLLSLFSDVTRALP